ncbi:TPA_asm: protein 3 [Raphanus virus 1]|uniref:Protein 3 n=1 Tax=Raphanus virus 1 TaxID=2977984 RepID=A0A9N6YJ44_9RHAB|nr:TPA_asm: protein 3 [Raphanus virus 1]
MSTSTVEICLSAEERLARSASKCLHPYVYLFSERIFDNLENIDANISKLIGSATKEFVEELKIVSIMKSCYICDITSRKVEECINLKVLEKVLNDQRVNVTKENDKIKLKNLCKGGEPICGRCFKSIIFHKDPTMKLEYLQSHRVPRILYDEDYSSYVFNNEEFSLYYDSFNDKF